MNIKDTFINKIKHVNLPPPFVLPFYPPFDLPRRVQDLFSIFREGEGQKHLIMGRIEPEGRKTHKSFFYQRQKHTIFFISSGALSLPTI